MATYPLPCAALLSSLSLSEHSPYDDGEAKMAGTKKRKRVGDDINGDDDDDDGDATYQEESVKKKAVRKPR